MVMIRQGAPTLRSREQIKTVKSSQSAIPSRTMSGAACNVSWPWTSRVNRTLRSAASKMALASAVAIAALPSYGATRRTIEAASSWICGSFLPCSISRRIC